MPKVISYTLQPVTSAECVTIFIKRTATEEGTGLSAEFQFEVKDGDGAIRETGYTTIPLTAGQRTTIANFVTSVAVPQFNTEKGL